jgi:hypothetical protein
VSYSILEVAMAPRKRKKSAPADAVPPQLATVHLHAAGVDVGAEEHWAAVPAGDDSDPVRRFGANTAALEVLADWFWDCGIPTVALESPGVDWSPLFEVLDARGFQVLWVDPGKRPGNGRPQSDGHDCQGLQRLHPSGVLSACVRPEEQVVVLRSYVRQRAALLADAARDIQPMQTALTQMHVKRPHVVSDLTGVTGLAIIRASLAGARDPQQWAQLRDQRCKQDAVAIAQALYGNWRAEHLFALPQALARYECQHRQLAACAGHIAAQLQPFVDRRQGEPLLPKPGQRRRHRTRPACDPRGPLHRMPGVDLPRMEGLDEPPALMVISELGLDMNRWPSEKHFTSWLGWCPHQKVSGGQGLSRRTRSTTNRAAAALRLAAASLPHSQSALGAYVRRMKSRLGPPKASTATAPKLARLIYSLLQHGTA